MNYLLTIVTIENKVRNLRKELWGTISFMGRDFNKYGERGYSYADFAKMYRGNPDDREDKKNNRYIPLTPEEEKIRQRLWRDIYCDTDMDKTAHLIIDALYSGQITEKEAGCALVDLKNETKKGNYMLYLKACAEAFKCDWMITATICMDDEGRVIVRPIAIDGIDEISAFE